MKPIDDLDTQWAKFLEENPPDKMPVIDENMLRDRILKELACVSAMSVKEYTLYKKWHEIKLNFPTKTETSLFGEQMISLIDTMQTKDIAEAKTNMWMPETLDAYMSLDPVLEYTDNSGAADYPHLFDSDRGSYIVERNNNLSVRWNTFKYFITNHRNHSNIVRNLYFLVKDKPTKKCLGIISISSDFLDLTPRDTHIGWSRTLKTQGRMINHTSIGSTIVPTQPLGYNYVGGKLLALLCLSDEVQHLWKQHYGDVMVGITTTSLYGNTKAGGLSQYDGLDYWKKMGFTSGSVSYEPEKNTIVMIRDWLKAKHTRKYFQWYVATNP
ncbi:MAG: Druantia anti-phage system protein DruA, partial [Candidatus Nitrosotenuis sp.]